MFDLEKPYLSKNGKFMDDRGIITFSNYGLFSFFNIKRFYIIENFQQNFIRAWHSHKEESKILIPILGNFRIGTSKLTENEQLSPDYDVFYINCDNILYIPKGYGNGIQNLDFPSKLMILSDKTLEESKNDDIRFPYNYFENFWEIGYR